MNNQKFLQAITEKALSYGKKAGATHTEVLFIESNHKFASIRQGELEEIEEADSAKVGFRTFVGNQSAMVSSSDLSDASLEAMAERSVAIAKALPEDPLAGPADPEQLAKPPFKDFDKYDRHRFSTEGMIKRAKTAEDIARAKKEITNSQGSKTFQNVVQFYFATSIGFSAFASQTSFGASVNVVASKGQDNYSGGDFSSVYHVEDLKAPEVLGEAAAEEAIRFLGAEKPKSGTYPIVFDRKVSASLLHDFLAMINGESVVQGTTMLKDAMGDKIFPEAITIVDNPHRMRGLGAAAFDDEGLPTQKLNLVEEGILKSWILDLKRARQLKLASTAHASRGLSSPPSPSAHSAAILPGELTPQEMIKGIDEGIYIKDFMGNANNLITGDYSRGAEGFFIKNGEVTKPLKEFTVSGNLKDIFASLKAANDLVYEYSHNCPTLMCQPLSVSGT